MQCIQKIGMIQGNWQHVLCFLWDNSEWTAVCYCSEHVDLGPDPKELMCQKCDTGVIWAPKSNSEILKPHSAATYTLRFLTS